MLVSPSPVSAPGPGGDEAPGTSALRCRRAIEIFPRLRLRVGVLTGDAPAAAWVGSLMSDDIEETATAEAAEAALAVAPSSASTLTPGEGGVANASAADAAFVAVPSVAATHKSGEGGVASAGAAAVAAAAASSAARRRMYKSPTVTPDPSIVT